MKYILLLVSVLFIIFPLYGLIKCLLAVNHLSSYGMGVLVAGVTLVTLGVFIFNKAIRQIIRINAIQP